MGGFSQIKLIDMIDNIGEDKTKTILSEFSCPLNRDVEDFILHKAITFARQGLSITTVITTTYKNQEVIIGYYTLANKAFIIKHKDISNRLWGRVIKFGVPLYEINTCQIPAPLIAQLGKNFNNGYNTLITGKELLQMAIDDIKITQKILGGKIIYLECEDKPRLIEFYNENKFNEFARRKLDADETNIKSDVLIQMLCYI